MKIIIKKKNLNVNLPMTVARIKIPRVMAVMTSVKSWKKLVELILLMLLKFATTSIISVIFKRQESLRERQIDGQIKKMERRKRIRELNI